MARYGSTLNRTPTFNGLNYRDPANLPLNKSLYPPAAVAKPFLGLSLPIQFNPGAYRDSFFDGSAFLPKLIQNAVQSYLGAPFNSVNYRDTFFDGAAFLPNIIQFNIEPPQFVAVAFNSQSYRDTSSGPANINLFPPAATTKPFRNVWLSR